PNFIALFYDRPKMVNMTFYPCNFFLYVSFFRQYSYFLDELIFIDLYRLIHIFANPFLYSFSIKSLHLITVLFNKKDRKSTRLNSSHVSISYAVFCLKKKKQQYYIKLISY